MVLQEHEKFIFSVIINRSFVIGGSVIHVAWIEELDLPVPIIICNTVVLRLFPVHISCNCGEPEKSKCKVKLFVECIHPHLTQLVELIY